MFKIGACANEKPKVLRVSMPLWLEYLVLGN